MRKIVPVLFAAAGLWAASGAHGYMFHSVMQGISISSGNALLADYAMNTIIQNENSAEAKGKSRKIVNTAIAKPGGMAGIDVLVAGYQPGQQAEARKVFAQMIELFEPVARKLNVPAHDMGSAAAALIAGSYAAYKNQVLPDEYFGPLVRQMQQALAADAKFARMSLQEKQRMYQILVGTGMFLTMAQLENMKNPDPQITAQLQSAGKEFLARFTHMDAASIQLNQNGLSQAR